MSIRAENLVWSVGKIRIIDRVSLSVPPCKVLGVLGPNGSGKSSLLRLLAGLRRPAGGQVFLEERDLRTIGRGALARRMALVEQHATTEANVRVQDVVSLGRIPHRSPFSGWSEDDEAAVKAALDRVDMRERAHRTWQSLSGGERQRVHLARALAQAPRELLLDEPTNHLDIQHQIALLKLVGELALTTVVALHDINHAAMFCDQLLILDGGKLVAQGTPEAVLSEVLMREVFRVEARIESSPHHGRPHIHYLI